MTAFPNNRDVATEPSPNKVGWRVNEFASDTGISRSLVYEKIAEGSIASVKLGAARIITTSPAEFLASLASPTGKQPEAA